MAAEWRLEVASLESPLPLTDADASIKKTNEVSRDPVHNRQTETRWPLNACSDISPRHFEQTAPPRALSSRNWPTIPLAKRDAARAALTDWDKASSHVSAYI